MSRDSIAISLYGSALEISSLQPIETAEISDVAGRTLLTLPGGHRTSLQANIGELPSGIYFIRIETDRGSEMKKIAVMQ